MVTPKKKSKKKTAKRLPTFRELPPVAAIPLDQLHLDSDNPRFGSAAGEFGTEVEVLDHIVNQFGIEDVLSSIAVNGYFGSEPIVGRPRSDGEFVVVEGNRRLAACLILTGDPRAKRQRRRTEHYAALHKRYGSKSIDSVPTIVIGESSELKRLESYLGVRHIAGAKQWDSYAKAAWVANAVEDHGLQLDDIIVMIGDNNRLARRMLMGYYIVDQLVDGARFSPKESHKKGSKSNPEFPFSWVYTAIGFKPVRTWLGVPAEPSRHPLDDDGIDKAAKLFVWMFGQKGKPPAIAESREIKDLARCIREPDLHRLLRTGMRVKDAIHRSLPVAERISDRLTRVHEGLRAIIPEIADEQIAADEIDSLIKLAQRVLKLAKRVLEELQSIRGAQSDEDDED